MGVGQRWTVRDRYGHDIYLTDERWDHILEFHNEMTDFEDELLTTLKRGRRRQDALDATVFSYIYPFDYLPGGQTHIVAIVKSKPDLIDHEVVENHFVLTAYQKTIYSQR